jgi:hypothetical protein
MLIDPTSLGVAAGDHRNKHLHQGQDTAKRHPLHERYLVLSVAVGLRISGRVQGRVGSTFRAAIRPERRPILPRRRLPGRLLAGRGFRDSYSNSAARGCSSLSRQLANFRIGDGPVSANPRTSADRAFLINATPNCARPRCNAAVHAGSAGFPE